MINPSEINPLSLPSVSLLDRKKLFRWQGVYFVIQDEQEILYIGQSPLIKNRWNQHQCLKLLSNDEKQRSRTCQSLEKHAKAIECLTACLPS